MNNIKKLILVALILTLLGLAYAMEYSGGSGGSGGVSFNGSAVDLMNSTLFNGTVPSDNSKVNKSGDNMTGVAPKLNFSGEITEGISPYAGGYNAYELWNNGTMRLRQRYDGGANWYVHDTNGISNGMIAYVNPGGGIGWSLRNGTLSNRSDWYMQADGDWVLSLGTSTSAPTIDYRFGQNGYFTINSLSGSGNASVIRADSTGKLIRDDIQGTGNYLCIATGTNDIYRSGTCP